MNDTKTPIEKIGDVFFMFLEKHGVSPSGKLLDVGGGPNSYGALYAKHYGCDVTVLDILDVSDTHKGIKTIQGNICDGIDVPDGTFDAIICHSTIEHVRSVDDALIEMNRLLKVGGISFLTVRPLFYSPYGYHERDRTPWEHLENELPEYPPDHHRHLNKLTMGLYEFLIRQQPWEVIDLITKPCVEEPPKELLKKHELVDLKTMEFFSLNRKHA